MYLKSLSINNFKAIGEAKIDLRQQGFVAVRGINNTDPNTLHCGTGKSSISDALSYVLCGTTVKGGRDVKNKYTSGDCCVSIDFERNGHDYKITRTKGKMSSLSVVEDGVDISGKGINDTKKLIEEMFPDFTPAFIGATMIFGQKQPNAFTSNTPSARKEILEHLTHSDFQIEEIKNRLSSKKTQVEEELKSTRTESDKRAGELGEQRSGLCKLENELENLRLPDNLLQETKQLQTEANELVSMTTFIDETIEARQAELYSVQARGVDLRDKLITIQKAHADKKESDINQAQINKDVAIKNVRALKEMALNAIKFEYDKEIKTLDSLRANESKLSTDMMVAKTIHENYQRDFERAKDELNAIEKSITCPTCGKPWLENELRTRIEPYKMKYEEWKSEVHKRSIILSESIGAYNRAHALVESHYANIEAIKSKIDIEEAQLKIDISKIEEEHDIKINEIKLQHNHEFSIGTDDIQLQLSELRMEYEKLKQEIKNLSESKVLNLNKIAQLNTEIKNNEAKIIKHNERTNMLSDSIVDLKRRIKETETQLLPLELKINTCNVRIDQLNKLSNFANKKFRTVLLEQTISLFEEHAKRVAHDYFDADITFMQDGSNIEITYQGKEFENLSGGEECVAVLIIQTALREFLYLLTGEDSNVLFVDECTDGTDVKLTEKIIGLIGDCNTDSVFIISHHDELNLPTEKTLVVEKNNNIAELHWE
jgi:DNA repair exonuclease SbcCD ATPase subunit